MTLAKGKAMKRISHGALAGLLVLAPVAAVAQSDYMPWSASGQSFDNRWYVAPFGSYTWADSNRIAEDGWGGGINLGKNLNRWWNLEFSAQYEKLDGKNNVFGPWNYPDYKNWTLGVNALLFFNRNAGYEANPGFQPFVLVGVGGIQDRLSGGSFGGSDSTWSWMADAGAGFLYHFNDRVAMRVDGRYRWDQNRGDYGNGSSFGDWVATAGLQIALGDKPRPPAPPPAPAPVATPAAPPPPAAPVTRTFDLSADGMFAFDSSTLTPVGKSRVDNFIKAVRESGLTVTSVKIVGHTDPLGSDAYNQKLSVARAKTVGDYLVSQGIAASVITTEGAGESQLKITEAECKAQGKAKTRMALIECLALDRRIEAHVTGTQKR